MASSGLSVIGLFILALASKSWAVVRVDMEDRVEVSLGSRAELTCLYKIESDPGAMILQWFIKAPGSNSHRQRIYFKDSSVEVLDQDSPVAGRVSVDTSVPDAVVLVLDPVHLEDEVLFVCQVNAMAEGTGEGSTALKVFNSPEQPKIEGVHSGIHINADISKIATCKVRNGYPLPNITWYRDLTPLQPVEGVVGIENLVTRDTNNLYTVESRLHLKVTKEDKDSTFYCESSYHVPEGMRMAESKRIRINVHYPPTYVNLKRVSPRGLVKEGDTVEIRCYPDGNPTPPVTLKHNGEDVEDYMLTDDQLGVVLSDVQRQDGGNYTCTALDIESVDPDSMPENSIQLAVHYLDDAVVLPKDDLELSQGDSHDVTCNAMSSLASEIVWFKDGQYLTQGNTLRLSNVTIGTTGEYRCLVTIPELPGLQTEDFLKVFVKSAPQITDVIEEELEDGDNYVNLTCVVLGHPSPAVYWSSPDKEVLCESPCSLSDLKTLGGLISTLTVKVTEAMSIVCGAKNELGEDERAIMVQPTNTETTPLPTTNPVPNSTDETNTKSAGPVTVKPPRSVKKGGSGVIIAVLIICVLLLAILGSVIYFLYKKGKIPCGRAGKQDITKEKSNKDAIVMEMKTDKSDEAVLLQGVNGDKRVP